MNYEMTIFNVILFPMPWPLNSESILFQTSKNGALVKLVASTDGSLLVICEFHGTVERHQFQRLIIHGAYRAIVVFTINKAGNCSLSINGAQIKLLEDADGEAYQLIGDNTSLCDEGNFNTFNTLGVLDVMEWFFLETVNDINQKLQINTKYHILKASGLLRLLLCDRHSVMEGVNKKYNIQLLFEISDDSIKPPITPDKQWSNPDISFFPGAKTRRVDLDTFLKFRCLQINGGVATVYDVIDACANLKGGAHFFPLGRENGGRKIVITEDECIRIFGEEPSLRALRRICRVVLKGIQPLANRILE